MIKKLLILLLLSLSSVSWGQQTGIKPILGRQLDWSNPLTKGLVGCWLLNEGRGNIVQDMSGNGNTGTFQGATYWSGGSVVMEAQSANITSATPALTGTGTIAFRFNGTGTPRSYGRFFAVDSYAEFNLFRNSVDTSLQLQINGTNCTAWTVPDLWGTGWNTIVITWDDAADIEKCYVNGILVGTSTTAFAWDAAGLSSTWHWGDINPSNYSASGRYDWISAYNRVLSASEVQQLYIDPSQMFKPSFDLYLMGGVVIPGVSGGQIIMIKEF